MMFNEVPFLERFAAARKAGFEGVEFLFPYEYPAAELRSRMVGDGLTLLGLIGGKDVIEGAVLADDDDEVLDGRRGLGVAGSVEGGAGGESTLGRPREGRRAGCGCRAAASESEGCCHEPEARSFVHGRILTFKTVANPISRRGRRTSGLVASSCRWRKRWRGARSATSSLRLCVTSHSRNEIVHVPPGLLAAEPRLLAPERGGARSTRRPSGTAPPARSARRPCARASRAPIARPGPSTGR